MSLLSYSNLQCTTTSSYTLGSIMSPPIMSESFEKDSQINLQLCGTPANDTNKNTSNNKSHVQQYNDYAHSRRLGERDYLLPCMSVNDNWEHEHTCKSTCVNAPIFIEHKVRLADVFAQFPSCENNICAVPNCTQNVAKLNDHCWSYWCKDHKIIADSVSNYLKREKQWFVYKANERLRKQDELSILKQFRELEKQQTNYCAQYCGSSNKMCPKHALYANC